MRRYYALRRDFKVPAKGRAWLPDFTPKKPYDGLNA